jgi:DNA-binding NarL/FixJ family response regulator
MIELAIVEDDDEIRKAFTSYFARESDFRLRVICASAEEFLERLSEGFRPHVVVMDIGLPGMSGIDAIRLVKEREPEIDSIVFSVFDDSNKIFDALRAGAVGYLLKSTPFQEIKEGIRLVRAGGSPMSPAIARKVIAHFSGHPKQTTPQSNLTDKEKEIVVGLVDGLSYKLIADRMEITIETVRFHIKNIYRKLHVHSKAEVISRSLKGNLR